MGCERSWGRNPPLRHKVLKSPIDFVLYSEYSKGMLQTVQCSSCCKKFTRPIRRYNEAIKFGWKQYCSFKCQIETKTTRITTECGRSGCNKLVTRKLNEHLRLGGAYCSMTCAAIVNNSKYPKKHAVVKICAICGDDFKRNKKYCSPKCHFFAQKIDKKIFFDEIENFVKLEERIPFKREFSHYSAIRRSFGS